MAKEMLSLERLSSISDNDYVMGLDSADEPVLFKRTAFGSGGGGGGGDGVTDGDKGEIVVSEAGSSWLIKALSIVTGKIADKAVTLAKMADLASGGVIGNAAAGAAGVMSFASLKTALGLTKGDVGLGNVTNNQQIAASGGSGTGITLGGTTAMQSIRFQPTDLGSGTVIPVAGPAVSKIINTTGIVMTFDATPVVGQDFYCTFYNPTGGPLTFDIPASWSRALGESITSVILAAGDERKCIWSPGANLLEIYNEQDPPEPAAGLADGDYGDVNVSAGGTVIGLKNTTVGTNKLVSKAVTLGKMADVASAGLLGSLTDGGAASVVPFTSLPVANWATPTAGVRSLNIGASREMRGNYAMSVNGGQVSTAGDVITVNLPSNHEAATGVVCLLVSQSDNGFTSYDAQTVGYGPVTRVDDDTLTIPRALGPTSGTSTSAFWLVFQQQFTVQSPFVYANSFNNGARRYFGNFSAGSNKSTDILGHCFELLKLHIDDFDHVDLTFGTGNDVLYSLNNSESITTMLNRAVPAVTTMLDFIASRGKTFTFQGIPSSETSSGISVAYALAIDSAMTALVESRYRGKGHYLPLVPLDILPGSATRDPAQVNTGGGVHNNAAGAQTVGLALADAYESLRPIPPRPPLICSPDDRRSQASQSDQLIEAGWANTGQNPNGMDSDFLGGANSCWNDFQNGNITTAGSAASVAFQIVAEPEGFGYTQQFMITSTGGANVMVLPLTGPTGSLLFDRVIVGQEYEGWLRHVVIPSSGAVLDSYSVRVMANVTYGTSKLCVLAAAIRTDGVGGDSGVPNPVELNLWIPRHKIPVGITSYYIEFKYTLKSGASGQTVSVAIDRLSLRKVS